jgi:hypothetical protein
LRSVSEHVPPKEATVEDDQELIREKVESRYDEATAGPAEPEYNQVEQVTREAQEEAAQNPPWTQGS